MYNSLYMYLCMNIIIDGKYAPCMQARTPVKGGSEQRPCPPNSSTLKSLQADVLPVVHDITSRLQGLSVPKPLRC